MFDGVIPLGEALRPLDLSRLSTRVACRQEDSGSRPRRISVSEDLPRTRWSKLVFWQLRLGGTSTSCHVAQSKTGSTGHRTLTVAGLLDGSWRGALPAGARLCYLRGPASVVQAARGRDRRARAACDSSA